jgi:hypothetical protein
VLLFEADDDHLLDFLPRQVRLQHRTASRGDRMSGWEKGFALVCGGSGANDTAPLRESDLRHLDDPFWPDVIAQARASIMR